MQAFWRSFLCALILSFTAFNFSIEAQTQAALQPAMRMVILPFRNITREPADEWLSESFSENLTMTLVKQDNLRLIERQQIQSVLQEQSFTQSAFADPETAPELGRLLGANKILLGNFQKIGNTLIVNTRIVDVATGQIESGLATQVRGQADQVLALQSQLSQSLVRSLRLNQGVAQSLTQSNPAYIAYRKALNLGRTGSNQSLNTAISLLKNAIQVDPSFAEAYTSLAEFVALRAQDPWVYPEASASDLQAAVDYANRALELKAEPGQVYRALAGAYYSQGQEAKAQATISEALQLLPGDTDTLLAYLRYHPQTGVAELKRLLADANQEDPWIQFAMGGHLLRLASQEIDPNLTEAQALLSQARQQLPLHPLIPLALAKIEVLKQNYSAAITEAEAALALEPNNFLLYYLAAQTLLYGPEQGRVQRWLEQSIALNPKFGYSDMTLGYLHWRNHRHPQALHYFKQAESIFPNNTALAFVRGKYYFAQRDFKQAKIYLQEALSRWGTDSDVRISKGAILIKLADIAADQGLFEQATSLYSQAMTEDREMTALGYRRLSHTQSALGQFETALKSFQIALNLGTYRKPEQIKADQQMRYILEQIQTQPQDPLLLTELGRLSMEAEAYAQAERHFKLALSYAPQHASIRYNYGLLLVHREQWSEAVSEFQQVLKQEPEHQKASYSMGLAYQRLGQTEQARATWQALLQRYPDYQQARQALSSLTTP